MASAVLYYTSNGIFIHQAMHDHDPVLKYEFFAKSGEKG